MKHLIAAAFGIGILLGGGVAVAQDAVPAAPPSRLRGTVDSLSGSTLLVTSRAGTHVTVTLPADIRVTALTASKLSEVKPGSFIGTAARTLPDGTLQAMEVQVFPEAMRGVGEGHHPWDLGADSSMTNGTVGSLVGTSGRTMTVTYKGGQQVVVVPASVPVVTFEPGSTAMLVAGANVVVNGTKDSDDHMNATFVLVGKDGLVPPM